MPETLEGPRRFGDFLLVGEIARGANGIVWYARHLSEERACAVKLLIGGSDASETDRSRFQIEAAAASSLNHPAIVRVYGAGEVKGQPYIAMELLPGETLADRTAFAPPSARQAAEWIHRLAEGLDHAHSRGILHRDIKPGNILLAEDGSIKLGDFGSARMLSKANNLTQTFGVVGTPMYLAPEIARFGTSATTTASDLFSLGAVFSELLTGQPPRRGTDNLEILTEIQESAISPPSRIRPDIPIDLDVICHRCITEEPSSRLSSARELADELGRYLRGEAIRSRPMSRLEWLGGWAGRHRLTASIAAMAMLAVLVGCVVTGWQWRRARTADRLLVNRLLLGPMSGAEEQARDGASVSALEAMASLLKQHPDHDPIRQRLAHWLSLPDFCPEPLHVWRHETGVRRVGYSGDGRFVWAALDDGRVVVHIASAANGPPAMAFGVRDVGAEALFAVNAEATRLVTWQRDRRLVSWKVSTAQSRDPEVDWEIPGVQAAVLSRNQSFWAVITKNRELWTGSIRSIEPPKRWEGASVGVTNGLISVSDDGFTVSTSPDARTILILRHPSSTSSIGVVTTIEPAAKEELLALHLAPHGDKLLTEVGGWFRFWAQESNRWVELERMRCWNGSRIAWNGDGRTVVTAANWRGFAEWNVGHRLSSPYSIELNNCYVAMALPVQGEGFAVATKAGCILQRRTYEGAVTSGAFHGAEVRHLAYSPDGSRILAAYADGVVVESRAVRGSSGNPVRRITKYRMNATRPDPTGSVILSSRAKTLAWNPSIPNQFTNVHPSASIPNPVVHSMVAGQFLSVGSDAHQVQCWGSPGDGLAGVAWVSPEPILNLWVQPDGPHVLAAGDSTLWIRRWNGKEWLAEGSWPLPGIVRAIFRHGYAEACLLDSRGHAYSWSSNLRLDPVRPIDSPAPLASVEFTPDSQRAIWIFRGQEACLSRWGRPIIEGQKFLLEEGIAAHAVSDGYLALASERGVKVWDLRRPDSPVILTGPFRPIHSIAVSSERRLVAIHSGNEWLRFHDIITGERLGWVYNLGRRQRLGGAWAVAFSGEGSHLWGWTTNGGVFSLPLPPIVPSERQWTRVLVDLAEHAAEDPVVTSAAGPASRARLERLKLARSDRIWFPQWDRFIFPDQRVEGATLGKRSATEEKMKNDETPEVESR